MTCIVTDSLYDGTGRPLSGRVVAAIPTQLTGVEVNGYPLVGAYPHTTTSSTGAFTLSIPDVNATAPGVVWILLFCNTYLIGVPLTGSFTVAQLLASGWSVTSSIDPVVDALLRGVLPGAVPVLTHVNASGSITASAGISSTGSVSPIGGKVVASGTLSANAAMRGTATAAAPAKPYKTVVLGDSPLLYYRLDEASGTTVTDSSPNAHTGTYDGAVTLGATGALTTDTDTAISLPGTSTAYVASPSLTLSGAFSLEAWVNPANVLATGQNVESIFATSLRDTSAIVYVPLVNGGSAKTKFQVTMGGTLAFLTSQTYAAGAWYHLVYTWDGTNQSIYINGTLDVTGTVTATTAAPAWGGSTYIGVNVANTTYPSPLQGSVDEAAIYGTALSASQVSAHYTAAATATSSAAAASILPDTSSGFHQAMIFNNHVSPLASGETGIDYVWGSSQATGAAAVHGYYMPWSQAVKTTVQGSYAPLSWFQTNHPDWLLYTNATDTSGNHTTLAQYTFDATNPQPIDYTNPACQDWVAQTGIIPAIQAGYSGISWDDNPSYNVYNAAGHYDLNHNWVAQYTGSVNDSTWASAQATALTQIIAKVHAVTPNAWFTINNGYFNGTNQYSVDPSIWAICTTAPGVNAMFDESGFSAGTSGARYTGTVWSDKISTLARIAQTQGVVICSQLSYIMTANLTDSNATARADMQWHMANYFLIKGPATYFFCNEANYYGYNVQPQTEFTAVANIGSAVIASGQTTDAYYASQGVSMRSFTGGLAIVNPDASTAYTLTFPAGTYKDLYGTAITTTSLAAASGLMLLHV